jgi:hypothetical protein
MLGDRDRRVGSTLRLPKNIPGGRTGTQPARVPACVSALVLICPFCDEFIAVHEQAVGITPLPAMLTEIQDSTIEDAGFTFIHLECFRTGASVQTFPARYPNSQN